jgi:Tfp pilus assembly protein PilE
MMKPAVPQRQRGMTFIGLLCILVLVGLIAYAVLRLIPVYLNYMKIARTMDSTAVEAKGENPDPGNIRRIIERHWAIEDPSAVDVKDIVISKDDTGVSLHVDYDDAVPYLGNVSLSVHFDKTVKVR